MYLIKVFNFNTLMNQDLRFEANVLFYFFIIFCKFELLSQFIQIYFRIRIYFHFSKDSSFINLSLIFFIFVFKMN
jgi:hypothetical protein